MQRKGVEPDVLGRGIKKPDLCLEYGESFPKEALGKEGASVPDRKDGMCKGPVAKENIEA